MAKAIKFTKEETEQVAELRRDVANLFTQLGQLQIEKKRRIEEIEVVEQDLHNQHSALVEKEQNMFKGLNEKYGDGNYDPNTNVFTPAEQKEEVLEQPEV